MGFEDLQIPERAITHLGPDFGEEVTGVQPNMVYGQDLNSSDVLFLEKAEHEITQAIADEFGVGTIYATSHPLHHSTTSRKTIIHTDCGIFFLKEKALYASDDAHIVLVSEFQNVLANSLVEIPPALVTTDGRFYSSRGDRKYVLSPAVAGEAFSGKIEQTRNAAVMLAQIHNISTNYTQEKEPENLTFKHSSDESEAFIKMAAELPRARDDPDKPFVISALYDIVKANRITPSSKIIKLIAHGDFTPSNLLFNESGEVVAIVDFDNSAYHVRIRDLAEALITFCGAINYKGNTSSLRYPISTAINNAHITVFMKNYVSQLNKPLSSEEIAAIPSEVALVWTELMALGLVRGDFNYSHVKAGLPFLQNLKPLAATLKRLQEEEKS